MVVDKRADIWAFGVVLFEMLTGQRAFGGDDISDTMANVLKTEPDWNAVKLRDVKPVQLQQVLEDAADEGFVKNTVSHVRWDMNQIFRYAVSIGILQRNPAAELFTPRRCSTAEIRVMTIEEVNLVETVLPLRERVIFKLVGNLLRPKGFY
jgi:site-specific recombinase XerD